MGPSPPRRREGDPDEVAAVAAVAAVVDLLPALTVPIPKVPFPAAAGKGSERGARCNPNRGNFCHPRDGRPRRQNPRCRSTALRRAFKLRRRRRSLDLTAFSPPSGRRRVPLGDPADGRRRRSWSDCGSISQHCRTRSSMRCPSKWSVGKSDLYATPLRMLGRAGCGPSLRQGPQPQGMAHGLRGLSLCAFTLGTLP